MMFSLPILLWRRHWLTRHYFVSQEQWHDNKRKSGRWTSYMSLVLKGRPRILYFPRFCIFITVLTRQLNFMRSKVPGHNDRRIVYTWGFRGWKEKSLHWKWDFNQSIFTVSGWANIWAGFNYSSKDRSTSSWHSWGDVEVTSNVK